jgi:hypothetical protein
MKTSFSFLFLFSLLLLCLNSSAKAQATTDPASLPVFTATSPITLDGRLLEVDWAANVPRMMFKIGGTPSGNVYTPTNFAIVKHPYKDTSTCYVRFLRRDTLLYFGLDSDDKQVCRFDWEGDGMFMKIKNSQGNDVEYKIYVGVVNNVPQFVYETNHSNPTLAGAGVGYAKPGTTIYDSTNTDNGYSAEMYVNLKALGFTTIPDTVQLLINIFDPDNYSQGVPPWGPNGNFAKQWWGSEWGGTYRKLALKNIPVPVELTSFTGSYVDNNVILEWSTATETNNRGFEIQRSTDGENFTVIGFVNGRGTTVEPQNYSFVDRNISPAMSHYYRLKQIDLDGTASYSDVLNLGEAPAIDFELYQNYPNPFNPSTKISFALPKDSNVELIISDLLGQTIATLLNGRMSAGNHSLDFDASGLSSGIYVYTIKINDGNSTKVESKKMTLIR